MPGRAYFLMPGTTNTLTTLALLLGPVPNGASLPYRLHLEAFLQQGCEAVLAEVYGIKPRPSQKLLHSPWRQPRIPGRSATRDYCTSTLALRFQHSGVRSKWDLRGDYALWPQHRHYSCRRLWEAQPHQSLTPFTSTALRQIGGRRGFASGNSKSTSSLADSKSPG